MNNKYVKILFISLISLSVALFSVSFWLFLMKNQKNKNLIQNEISESFEIGKVIVPNLLGKNFKEATRSVYDYNLVMISEEFNEDVPEGSVISQTPAPGALVLPGFTIAAKVSKGSEIKVLPDIAGKTLSEVSAELTSLSLVPVEIRQPGDVPEGTVLGYRSKLPGEIVKYGEKIFILISSG
jgi:serine/threonine-protein kinase